MRPSTLLIRAVVALLGAATLLLAASKQSNADSYAYNNLLRSRDGLLGQREALERARNDCLDQIARLNSKVGRIDSYLTQVDNSLRDVEDALARTK